MRLDHLLIGFVLFSVFVVTGVLVIGDVNENYGLTMSTDQFNDTYDTIDEMYEISRAQYNDTVGADIDDDDSYDSYVTSSFSAVRMVYKAFDIIGNIIRDIASTLHVPAYFVTFALTALLISIIFGIIYLFVRFRP